MALSSLPMVTRYQKPIIFGDASLRFSVMGRIPQTKPSVHQPGAPWSIQEAAGYLQISQRHLIRLINDAKVTSFLLGRRRFISDSEIRRLANGGEN